MLAKILGDSGEKSTLLLDVFLPPPPPSPPHPADEPEVLQHTGESSPPKRAQSPTVADNVLVV